MSELQHYQKSLIDGSLTNLKAVIESDYSIGKMNHSLASLKNGLIILPSYKHYTLVQIKKIIHHYQTEEQAFYQQYHKMNPKYIEVILNLGNFKP